MSKLPIDRISQIIKMQNILVTHGIQERIGTLLRNDYLIGIHLNWPECHFTFILKLVDICL